MSPPSIAVDGTREGVILATVLIRLVCAALAVVVAACEASPPAPTTSPPVPGRPAPTTAPVDPPATAPATGDLVWVERVPDGVAPDAALPIVVGVHGLGDRPESFCHVFDDLRAPVRIACPRAPTRHGRGWSWFPLEGDDASRSAAIAASADRLASAIERLAQARRAPAPPVVTGFSQGGALAFAIAVRHPGAIARAIPVGGWLPRALWPADDARVAPITALHGEADPRVPFEPTRALVAALAGRGAPATIRGFPGVGHTIPPEVRGALLGAVETALDAAAGPGEAPRP